MAPIIPKAFDVAVVRSGLSLGVGMAKAGQFIRIGITAAAQAQYFGGVLDPEKDALAIELSDEPGSNHVMKITLADPSEAGAFALGGGIRNSVSMKLVPWTQIADGKRPVTELPVVTSQSGKMVIVKLPEWARPPLRKVNQGKSIFE